MTAKVTAWVKRYSFIFRKAGRQNNVQREQSACTE